MRYNMLIVLAFFRESGLPPVETEWKFDAVRKWRFDFAWPEHKLALEVEGGIFRGGRHTRGAGFKKDMVKYNSAAMAGWRVLRVQPSEICMTETVRMVKECIG